jgi:hypothetical protein
MFVISLFATLIVAWIAVGVFGFPVGLSLSGILGLVLAIGANFRLTSHLKTQLRGELFSGDSAESGSSFVRLRLRNHGQSSSEIDGILLRKSKHAVLPLLDGEGKRLLSHWLHPGDFRDYVLPLEGLEENLKGPLGIEVIVGGKTVAGLPDEEVWPVIEAARRQKRQGS